MSATNFNANTSLAYTPPGGPSNSGVAVLGIAGTYNAGQSGIIDIPSGTVVGTEFSVPFGSITSTKLLVIQNKMSSDVGVRINGAGSNNFKLAAGGIFMYASPSAPGSEKLTDVSIITTVDPTQTEQVLFFSFGD
jgi:hypothetical protein